MLEFRKRIHSEFQTWTSQVIRFSRGERSRRARGRGDMSRQQVAATGRGDRSRRQVAATGRGDLSRRQVAATPPRPVAATFARFTTQQLSPSLRLVEGYMGANEGDGDMSPTNFGRIRDKYKQIHTKIENFIIRPRILDGRFAQLIAPYSIPSVKDPCALRRSSTLFYRHGRKPHIYIYNHPCTSFVKNRLK